MENREAIEQAIKLCGGTQDSLAKRIGRTQQFVSKLLNGGAISAETALLVENATAGKVPAHLMRPDLFKRGKHRAQRPSQ